jgi:hypothetical protein
MVTAYLRKSAWRVTTQRVGPAVLGRTLSMFRINSNDKRNLLNAYSKYIQALNNTSNRRAHNHAKAAAIKFTNTMFKMYEKKMGNKASPVSNGISNGVQKSIIYWTPGVLYRRAFRAPARRASTAPVARASRRSRV